VEGGNRELDFSLTSALVSVEVARGEMGSDIRRTTCYHHRITVGMVTQSLLPVTTGMVTKYSWIYTLCSQLKNVLISRNFNQNMPLMPGVMLFNAGCKKQVFSPKPW